MSHCSEHRLKTAWSVSLDGNGRLHGEQPEQRAKKTSQDQMKDLVELRGQLQVHFAAVPLPALSGE